VKLKHLKVERFRGIRQQDGKSAHPSLDYDDSKKSSQACCRMNISIAYGCYSDDTKVQGIAQPDSLDDRESESARQQSFAAFVVQRPVK